MIRSFLFVIFFASCEVILDAQEDQITSSQCQEKNGTVINTMKYKGPVKCSEGELGRVTDMKCPCICCVGGVGPDVIKRDIE